MHINRYTGAGMATNKHTNTHTHTHTHTHTYTHKHAYTAVRLGMGVYRPQKVFIR